MGARAILTESPSGQAGMQQLTQLLDNDLQACNAFLLNEAQSHIELIPEVARHVIASGGKRIRPLLTMASARLCNYNGDMHVNLAACVEFIHTATLLHDDVVDSSAMRRGLSTANHVWGNKTSILVGDYLLSRAFCLMVGTGSLEILDVLSHASSVIAEGEVTQLVKSFDINLTHKDYIEIIGAKTACLFAAGCEAGAILSQASPTERTALKQFGQSLGVCFQIIDDVLDYTASAEHMGKATGDDFLEGKVTLPILLLRDALPKSELPWLEQLFDEDATDTRNDTSLTQVLNSLHKHDVIAQCHAQAKTHAQDCHNQLKHFPASDLTRALAQLVDDGLTRGH